MVVVACPYVGQRDVWCVLCMGAEGRDLVRIYGGRIARDGYTHMSVGTR